MKKLNYFETITEIKRLLNSVRSLEESDYPDKEYWETSENSLEEFIYEYNTENQIKINSIKTILNDL